MRVSQHLNLRKQAILQSALKEMSQSPVSAVAEDNYVIAWHQFLEEECSLVCSGPHCSTKSYAWDKQ